MCGKGDVSTTLLPHTSTLNMVVAAQPPKHWFPTTKLHSAVTHKAGFLYCENLESHIKNLWEGNNAVDTSP